MKLPPLKRNQNSSGKKTGNYWIRVGTERVNLMTKDATEAIARSRRAMKGARDFTTDGAAAADATIAALEQLDTSPPPPIESSQAAPALPPPAPLQLVPTDPPPPAAEKTADGWAADANAAAASSEPSSAGTAADPAVAGAAGGRPRFADLPFLQTAFVSASKFAVQTQIGLHIWAARVLFGVNLPPLEKPPASLEEFMAAQGTPWPNNDAREPGRQVYEGIFRRLVPEELPIPDWILAPALVALFTLPMQIPHATRVKPEDSGEQPADAAASEAPAQAA